MGKQAQALQAHRLRPIMWHQKQQHKHIECVTNGIFSRSKWRHRHSRSRSLSLALFPLSLVAICSNAHLTVYFIQHHIMKTIQMLCVLKLCFFSCKLLLSLSSSSTMIGTLLLLTLHLRFLVFIL